MRYILFAHSEICYYRGGSSGYCDSGNEVSSLVNSALTDDTLCRWHVFDTQEHKVVAGATIKHTRVGGKADVERVWWDEGVDIYGQ